MNCRELPNKLASTNEETIFIRNDIKTACKSQFQVVFVIFMFILFENFGRLAKVIGRSCYVAAFSKIMYTTKVRREANNFCTSKRGKVE